MPVRSTAGFGGHVCHVMNRAIQGHTLFTDTEDYMRFVCTLERARTKVPIRILAYCVMPNHWHLLLWPAADPDVPRFVHRLSAAHAWRHRKFTGTSGRGAVYQGRYRIVGVNDESGLFRAIRYIERNPVRAGLVDRCEDWQWSSATTNRTTCLNVDAGPVARPAHWASFINGDEPPIELGDIRTRIAHGAPIGENPVVSSGAV